LNRRGLEAELPKLLALSRRYQAPVSAVMLDIDRFKRVNDTYGHPVGDEVLRRLGRILEASVRKEDLAVRYGGEEFLLVLFGADKEAAKEVVERIRERFRAERVPPIPHPLTLSAGVAGEGCRRAQRSFGTGSSRPTTPSSGPRRRGGTG
jgi:diguanylate cyclase (GGDEF)-like protein